MGTFTEAIEHWISEFLVSTTGELNRRFFGDRATAVLVAFMENACGIHVAPEDLEESNVRDGIAIGVAPLELTAAEREGVPSLIESFLGHCESAGRLSGGEALGSYARVTATAHLLKKKVRKATIKVGPNDPCPCGSGRKYKKCCMSL